ncbi:protein-methionine-sulfoxide reductase heme-binding subunit MsrQ [Bradyrhizobium sp. 139]|uniref:protein-methionine-sulfoxide reductase heme-binding subunit MsrQ n=1 Tax=Bradyrhizobium sp. 139 TaxID=2782616 RepID=UPI001FFBF94C|nr:protein-methionine-sulfoxide reductase heme-binding subunit MsrQ [Bradyrhizobium sp. 139]MCK1744820.1 protein-methionine-sulfoxide reductase heme-binding subunit MsrQ [Bradyrhizobium sp. 139]
MERAVQGGRNWNSASIWLLYFVALLPAGWEFYLGVTDNLGADPVKTFERFLGLWAIRFLILTLVISPIRNVLGINLIRYRRALGLTCFYYVLMHFSVYALLDQELAVHAIVADIAKRPFIMLGATGLVLLVPLAVTSNANSIRRLGKHWLQLHRLIYAIAICGAIHLFLATKILSIEQWLYLALLTLSILHRCIRPFTKRQRLVNTAAVKGWS